MKRLKTLRCLWKGICLTGILLPLGCKTSPRVETPMHEMHSTLQSGARVDRAIAKENARKLPDQVRQALRPNFDSAQNGSNLNLPSDKRFDLSADQVDAKTFFLSLVQDTPYNITVHPAVTGKISLQLKKVTIKEALNTVRNVYGFDYRQTPQGIEILPATIQTRTFSVNYLDLNRKGSTEMTVLAGGSNTSGSGSSGSGSGSNTSSTSGGASSTAVVNSKITTASETDLWKELEISVAKIIGADDKSDCKDNCRSVAVNKLSSLIVVRAMPDELRRVEDFLRGAETSLNRQVILEAKVLEVELNEGFQAGINWQLVSGKLRAAQVGGNAVRSTDVLDATPEAVTPFSQPISLVKGPTYEPATNVGSFGGVFALALNYKNLAAFVELLETQGNVQVLSSPRVSTTNNQKALIKVGKDEFFVTNVSSSTTVVPGTTAAQNTPNVTFESFFSGIALDVTPHISQSDYITLHIHPRVSAVENKEISLTLGTSGTQKYPLATTNIREADSIVRARNGELVVIGGLMKDQEAIVRTGVPILKNIPGIGKLFRHTSKRMNKSELVILLRPIVVENKTWADQLDGTIDRFHQLDGEMCERQVISSCPE